MSKIAFVSVRNYNFGSILQSYALQQELFDAGIDNEILFYKKRNIFKQFLRLFNYNLLVAKYKDIKRIIMGKINPKYKKIHRGRNEAFSTFLKENLVFSPELKGRKALVSYGEKFSSFILGSDQVWNPMLLGGDYYTLNWVKNNKIKVSYASSFGVAKIPLYQINRTKAYLSRFDMISVREESGAEIVRDLIGKKVDVCCDPTILTKRSRWDELIKNTKVIDEPYIFCYFIGNNPEQREFAKTLAKYTKCKILAIKHIDEYIKSDEKYGDFDIVNVGPKEFVSYIANAKYVCTDSFHGTVFSILYNRTFFTFKRFTDNKSNSMNSRVYNLLGKLDLQNRLFDNKTKIDEVLNLDIDWNNVDEKIEILRCDSKKYFERAINCLRGVE